MMLNRRAATAIALLASMSAGGTDWEGEMRSPELQKEFDRQSMEADPEKRRRLVWEIDKRLQEEAARPIIYHLRAATCWQPRVKGLTIMVNSQYNGWRFEDLWLDE